MLGIYDKFLQDFVYQNYYNQLIIDKSYSKNYNVVVLFGTGEYNVQN